MVSHSVYVFLVVFFLTGLVAHSTEPTFAPFSILWIIVLGRGVFLLY